jgi:DNA-binding response OmpR family regulator
MDDWARRERAATVDDMTATLLLADAEPETRGFLERHLPEDGFELVPSTSRFDLVLAGGVEALDRWARRAPVIVLGPEEADVVDRVHAFRRGCDDYVARPFDYQELVGVISREGRGAISRVSRGLLARDARLNGSLTGVERAKSAK